MNTNLYVGNLSWDTTNEQLENLFQDINQIDKVRAKIEIDKMTGQSRGFAFIEIPEDKTNLVIDRMHGYELNGRELIVN